MSWTTVRCPRSIQSLILAALLVVLPCTALRAQADFVRGDVNADGLTSSAPNVTPLGRTAADDGGVYQNFAGTVTWSCRGAPTRAVDITMTSVAADHTSAGAPMADDDLEVQIPQVGTNGTSEGWALFTLSTEIRSERVEWIAG